MAIARPTFFTAISGKLGPVEFAQRGITTIIRNAKKPKTKVTPAILEAQRIHAYKIRIWRFMTQTYPYRLQEWQFWAATHPIKNRLGHPRTLSAFQYFMRLYVPREDFPSWTMYTPIDQPRSPLPTTFTASITAPSTFIVTSQFDYSYPMWFETLAYFSPPITPSTNLASLPRHYLGIDSQYYNTLHNSDYTAKCIRLQRGWIPGQQILVTLIGIARHHERSPESTYLVTVAAP